MVRCMKEHEFMSQVRRISMAGCLWLALLSSPAQEVVTTKTCFPVNQPIPDGSVVGMADQRTIALPGPFSITDLKVSVTVAGGFNGDVYCYLRHESGFVVLLNRPGRCATNSMGYEDTGFKATFSASATNDFHRYRECSGLPCDLAADW